MVCGISSMTELGETRCGAQSGFKIPSAPENKKKKKKKKQFSGIIVNHVMRYMTGKIFSEFVFHVILFWTESVLQMEIA